MENIKEDKVIMVWDLANGRDLTHISYRNPQGDIVVAEVRPVNQEQMLHFMLTLAQSNSERVLLSSEAKKAE